MPSIGSLGVQRDVVPDDELLDFDYFGTNVRVNPAYTDADIIDFVELGETLDDEDPKAAIAVKDAIRTAIHPDDFDTFWRLSKENRQSIDDRMEVLMAIVSALGDRPTQRSSDSSAGPSTTHPRSEDGSYSRVISSLEGRRDLQLLTADSHAAQVSRAARTG